MAKVKWTPEQADAISARRGSILVSAAAGSGKTAVLVQRAIERLTDKENPTAADRLLVVTFTKAAAAEMRARLEKRIAEMIQKNPRDKLLRKQSLLLSQASIGTMHSFCSDILREFFHLLNLPPTFKIIPDKQEEEMKNNAASEVLNEFFENTESSLLADTFSGEKDDKKLSKTVISLYEYMSSHPYPKKWLNERAQLYLTAENLGESPWGEIILSHAEDASKYGIQLINEAFSIIEDDENIKKSFQAALESYLSFFTAIIECVQNKDWNKIALLVRTASFAGLSPLKGYNDNLQKKRATSLRDKAKKIVDDQLKKLFSITSEHCIAELRTIGEITAELALLTKQFSERYQEKKLEKGFFDYGDLEHYTIQLLLSEDGERTAAAQELSNRFDEIMIDEFQDINEIQDVIFKSISKDETNLFMVGDVKQSIYGFRRSEPQIFIDNRDRFEKYDCVKDRYPAYIMLDRNFRSRIEVTDSVNFIFSQLMRRKTGDIDYTEEEALRCGANYPEKDGYETELHFVKRNGDDVAETEGRFISLQIQEMIASGFTIQDKNGERPVQYKDFCILLRKANAHAHDYAVALQKNNIPVRASVAGGNFFATREIGVIFSFLRVIDNPNQDIPLLTVLMSPIYGFLPDDLFMLRRDNPKISLYVALLNAASKDIRYKTVVEDIQYYRAVSATLASDKFIELLYQKTDYTDMVLSMEDGENRLQNLHLLQKHARDYESSAYHGISGFVRFLSRLQQNDSDFRAAETGSGSENCVQIMSVHKSKGLEFPVCILAGCDRESGGKEKEVPLHPILGLGIKLPDIKLGARFNTMSKEAILLDLKRRESAESMRILYVALTRAKEKLIVVSAVKDTEKLAIDSALQVTSSGISDYAVNSSKSFSEWLMFCALRHPDGRELRRLAELDEDVVSREYFSPWHIGICDSMPETELQTEENPVAALPDEVLYETVRQNISFVYPFSAETETPAKVTASGLTAKENPAHEDILLSRPAWLGEKGMSAAERGTALHNFMQYADFHKAASNPEAELAYLTEKAFISAEHASAVDLSYVRRFFESDLGQRVLKAEDVQKEQRFTVEIPAEEAGFENPHGTMVVLQGAVDCFFIENNVLHIIDFKTDRVKSAEALVPIYQRQLQLYARALGEISDFEIGSCYLYAMYTGESVQVPAGI